ncbi:anti-sigma factor [Paralcaligenes ureilyticus]|uniref:Anti-sigma-K factor RskA n=1 Tax=Paralcaligenes ureilyticus TaxID=627131 RepID=A0A4R3MAY7_9BURK|nr:anti-sigma factor [Paralcaligenes ureilyticus]TCT10446.1 anti-sigma-K factor RskA [Paralcaligenes ureilyticus]
MSIEQASHDKLLIAEYTLGLLSLQEAAQAQALLGNTPDAVVEALKWEDHFLGLVDQLHPITPPANLMQHIQDSLGQKTTPARGPRRWPHILKEIIATPWRSIWLWRVLCVALALAAVTFALKPKLSIVQLVPTQAAILQAPGQSSTPGWVGTFDKQHNLVLKPLVQTDVPASSSAQLWTHATETAPPQSLGVIDPNQTVTVPAATIGQINPGQLFEITLEAKGGAPSGTPGGPILFIGRLVEIGR